VAAEVVVRGHGGVRNGSLSVAPTRWDEVMDLEHLERLRSLLGILTNRGEDTTCTRPACYSGAGFSPVLHAAEAQGQVTLVGLDPLRAQDFDALAQTADNWLATRAALAGVVVHARDFPGWENIKSLLRHVRFVRDHHRKVRKIALAAHTRLAELMPHFADHFVQAEVRQFDYDELDDAVGWAVGPPSRHA
jgi:hypothetical protein